MKKEKFRKFPAGIAFLAAFVLWTVAVRFIDVDAIGPEGSSVGFAGLNGFFHTLTGVNMTLYEITDWLGLVPIAVCLGFALLGLFQWIKGRSLKRVDFSIFVLGGFYIAVMAVYILFEEVVINYRPVLIEGYLEASYPSSTTLLVTCVMPVADMQLRDRIKNRTFGKIISVLIWTFTVFMVAGRILSGVHWLSDIIGGLLLSAGLVLIYAGVSTTGYSE